MEASSAPSTRGLTDQTAYVLLSDQVAWAIMFGQCYALLVGGTGDFMRGYIVLLMMISVMQPQSAFPAVTAISVELAKKCRAMAIKAHPPQTAGTKAYAAAERNVFNRCVSRKGQMNDDNAGRPSQDSR
jgi:hypothetical protein